MPTENEETKQEAKETGILFLDNPQLYNLVVQRVANEVEGRLSRRVLIILSVGGVVLSILAGVYHNVVVDEAAKAAVDNAIGELREQVEVASLSLEFTDLMNSIEKGEEGEEGEARYNKQEKDAAISLLERAAELRAFTERAIFLTQLETLLDVLAGTGADVVGSDINRLEEMYRGQISKSPGIILTLTLHYGFQVLATPGAPDDWSSNVYSSDFDRYGRYISLARLHGFSGAYVFYQMLVENLRSRGDDNIVREIIKGIDSFDERDSNAFWKMVETYATDAVSVEPTAETTRISERTVAFLEKYQDVREEFGPILHQIKFTQSTMKSSASSD